MKNGNCLETIYKGSFFAMNLSFALVSLAIVMLINFIYRSNKVIPMETSVLFKKMIGMFIAMELVDVICCIFGKHLIGLGMFQNGYLGMSPIEIGFRACVHLYFVILINTAFASLKYNLLSANKRPHSISMVGYVVSAGTIALPFQCRVSGIDVVYEGILITYSNLVCFLIIFISGCIVIKYRNQITRKKKEAFTMWAFFWIVTAFLSAFIQNHSYVSVCCAFGLLITFIFVENPENMQGLHKDTMLFYYANECLQYFEQMKIPSQMVCLKFENDETMKCFVTVFKKYPNDFFMFEDGDRDIYTVFADKNIYLPILKDYIFVHKLQAFHFDESYPKYSTKMAEYFKEHINALPKGILKTVTKEELEEKEKELQMKHEIEQALSESRIITFVQPIYNVKKEKFTCGECLCRIKKENGEILLPFHFISVAEKYGLICNIETAMFRNMCAILQRKEELGIEYLESNLSIKKGESDTLFDEYFEIMEYYGIDGKSVNLEITETDILAQKNALIKNINNLKELGVRFSLDDFGTGESNLGYVIDMPVDIMKFDREIFQKAVEGSKARIVVENTIKMAHNLGLKVVVEGVEKESDVTLCKEMDVDYIQGYYFSKPISSFEFELFCKTKNFK